MYASETELRAMLRHKNTSLVTVTGPGGMGKTRLAEEADTLARAAGVETAWVTCWAEAGAPPFWPWIELLQATAELPAELAGADTPSGPSPDRDLARFRLFDAVRRELEVAARARPLLLVIDDLHWADVPSLRLLDFLAPFLHNIVIDILSNHATPRSLNPNLFVSDVCFARRDREDSLR